MANFTQKSVGTLGASFGGLNAFLDIFEVARPLIGIAQGVALAIRLVIQAGLLFFRGIGGLVGGAGAAANYLIDKLTELSTAVRDYAQKLINGAVGQAYRFRYLGPLNALGSSLALYLTDPLEDVPVPAPDDEVSGVFFIVGVTADAPNFPDIWSNLTQALSGGLALTPIIDPPPPAVTLGPVLRSEGSLFTFSWSTDQKVVNLTGTLTITKTSAGTPLTRTVPLSFPGTLSAGSKALSDALMLPIPDAGTYSGSFSWTNPPAQNGPGPIVYNLPEVAYAPPVVRPQLPGQAPEDPSTLPNSASNLVQSVFNDSYLTLSWTTSVVRSETYVAKVFRTILESDGVTLPPNPLDPSFVNVGGTYYIDSGYETPEFTKLGTANNYVFSDFVAPDVEIPLSFVVKLTRDPNGTPQVVVSSAFQADLTTTPGGAPAPPAYEYLTLDEYTAFGDQIKFVNDLVGYVDGWLANLNKVDQANEEIFASLAARQQGLEMGVNALIGQDTLIDQALRGLDKILDEAGEFSASLDLYLNVGTLYVYTYRGKASEIQATIDPVLNGGLTSGAGTIAPTDTVGSVFVLTKDAGAITLLSALF